VSRASVAWDELVTAATVGTGTRPLPHTGFHPTTVTAVADESADADGAARLLELAAMETAAYAVTVQPSAATPVEPAPAERRPVMTDRLADLLLLAVRTDRDVATDLLDTVAGAGLVLPPAALPAFLELGRDSRIAPVLTDLVGERGRWLVDLDEEWAIFLPAGLRASAIAAQRRVDPAAARELVEAGWVDASADERVRMLDALAQGLGGDDVPFLESAVTDRSAAVGTRAVTLLTRLGGRLPLDQQPSFGERAVRRARPVVRLVRQGLLRSPALEVVAPEGLDQKARGDLLSGPEPGFRKGQRAWWLEQIIQRAPLALWEKEFGRSPVELVALPVVGDFARELHPGWRAAAWAQQNLAWARALLALPDAPVDPSLVSVLPAGEQAALAVRVLDSVEAGDGVVLSLLSTIDGPWPADLATAVVGYVERLLATAPVRESTPLLQLVARRLPVRTPFAITTIQARAASEDWADQQARSVGFDHPWRALLTSLSATLSVRARVDDELRRSAP
jgi:hypothetical protein